MQIDPASALPVMLAPRGSTGVQRPLERAGRIPRSDRDQRIIALARRELGGANVGFD